MAAKFYITLALCLCALPVQAQTVRVDGFDARQRAQVLRAVNEANASGAHYAIIDSGPAAVAIVANPGQFNGDKLAVTLGKTVIVNTSLIGARDLCGIVEHELGHVAGKPHDDHGIMGAAYGADTGCR